MPLGNQVTRKAAIGSFELRIGPLNKAGLLTADHSVGIVDSVKLDIQMDSVELLAGFPQLPVDTAITKFATGFTGTLRESSRRNLNVLLGNGLFDYDTTASDISGSVNTTSAIAVGATSINMSLSFTATLAVGDTVVIYDTANPSNVSISTVAAFTPIAGSVGAIVGLAATQPVVGVASSASAFAAGSTVKLYKSPIIAGGAISGTPNYMSAQLVSLDRATARPIGFNFWKTAISSGPNIGLATTEFSSFDLQLKAMRPSALDYATGGVMAHLASVIPNNPVFLAFQVSDGAVS